MSYGKGHIQQLGKRKWRIYYDYGKDSVTGKRNRLTSVVNGSKADANKLLDKINHEHETGVPFEAYKMTLESFLLDWLDEKKRDLAHTTYVYYARLVEVWTVPYIGQVCIAEITPAVIKKWHKTIAEKGATPLTVKDAHKTLKSALKDAVFEGILAANPCDRVRNPKAETNKRGYLVPSEAARMTQVLDGMRESGFTMAVRIGLATGARRGEVLAFQWRDFNASCATLKVERSLTQVDSARRNKKEAKEIKSPKTKSGKRVISLDCDTVNRLIEWKPAQKKELETLGLKQSEETPICCSLYSARFNGVSKFAGKYLDPQNFTNSFRKFCDENNFKSTTGKRLCFHELRHTQATYLLSANTNSVTVSGRLGHSSPRVTEEMYAHIMPERDRECADMIGDILHGSIRREEETAQIIDFKTA